MGSIYTVHEGVSSVSMSINACGDCDDIDDCLDDISFNCGCTDRITGWGDGDCIESSSYSSCSSSTCGCSDFIDGISFSDTASDSECFDPSLSPAEIAGIVCGVIGGVILLIICYCLIKRYRKKSQQSSTKSEANGTSVFTFGWMLKKARTTTAKPQTVNDEGLPSYADVTNGEGGTNEGDNA